MQCRGEGAHGSLECLFQSFRVVFPEHEVLVFSKAQFQEALGNRCDPPELRPHANSTTQSRCRMKARDDLGLGRAALLCLALSRKGLLPASSKAIVFLVPSWFGENKIPADSMA